METNFMIIFILILQINYIIAPCYHWRQPCLLYISPSCSNKECLKKATEHLQGKGHVTIGSDHETLSFKCNEDYGLVGNPTVTCDRCIDKLIGTLPTCQPVIVSTNRTISGSTTTVTSANSTNITFTTESTTATGPQKRTKSDSNNEKLTMQNLSLIAISMVLIVIIVGLTTFIWIKRCKKESLCWKQQPHANPSRVISEYDDSLYDYPMVQFTTETQSVQPCGSDVNTLDLTRRDNEKPSSSTSHQNERDESHFKHNECYGKV